MKVKPNFVIREVCGQNILVAEGEENIDFRNIISMNETSSYLWNKVEGLDSFTVDDMVDFLRQSYDVDIETAKKDCETLAAQWGKIGIISGDDIPQIDVEIYYTQQYGDDDKPKETKKEKPKKHSFLGKLFHK